MNLLSNIWAGIQDYLDTWLKDTKGYGAYAAFEFDLSEARTNEKHTYSGDQIIVTDCDNQVFIKPGNIRNDLIDVNVVRQIHQRFDEFYITNAASSGTLKFLCGTKGVFQCDPSIRIISGKYGSQYKPVAIDSSGNIIMILKDPSSANYAAIDTNGYLTSVMKGDDSGTLRTVAVDGSGNIVGIFKGDYSGALKTIAVDTEGRIQAVLTDPEDVFGNPHYMGAGELAVRNGSIVIHDKRGNIVLLEDFEGKANTWTYTTYGTGSTCALNQDFVFMGNWAVKMVAGSDGQQMASITRYFPLPASTKIGGAYCFTVDSNTLKMRIMQIYFDTTTQWQALMYIDTVNDRLQIQSSSLVTIANNIGFSAYSKLYHNVKLVVDYSTHKYVRAIIDDIEYDLSAYDLASSASGTGPYMYHRLANYANGATNPVTYVDNFIFTHNEEV